MPRLFVGTFLSDESRKLIAGLHKWEDRLSGDFGRKLRFVRPEKLHLTWLFLGSVDEQQIPNIHERLVDVLSKQDRLELSYDKPEFWPDARSPRNLVLVPKVVPRDVINLAARVGKVLGEFVSQDKNRFYRPHITLCRIGAGPKEPLEVPDYVGLADILPIEHQISQIDLVESHLGQTNDAYQSLKTYKLA